MLAGSRFSVQLDNVAPFPFGLLHTAPNAVTAPASDEVTPFRYVNSVKLGYVAVSRDTKFLVAFVAMS